jgi:3,5-epimerase/4-reductase
MKWLLYGHRGWIGSQIKKLLYESGHDVICGLSRANNYLETYKEIKTILPDRVISTIGRTSGIGYTNIDYLENNDKLLENVNDNLHGPINLAYICQYFKIHFTYLGTGCIYEYNNEYKLDGKGFTEECKPNFFGSNYSIVKGVTDSLIRNYTTTLNARIRMPITDEEHEKNFITKIVNYKNVISIDNSMSVLPVLLPILIDLATNQVIGTINLTNPGTICHAEILQMYKAYIDPYHTYNLIDVSELATIGKRSNNYLDTTKLQQLYPNIPHIIDAVKDVMIKMRYNMYKQS